MKSITVKDWVRIPTDYTGHVKFTDGDQCWLKDARYHREDGPAFVGADGYRAWMKDNHYHREDGPAIIDEDDIEYWWLDDLSYTKDGYYRELYRRGKITEQELFIELL